MRILHVASHLDDVGDGITNSTVDLACLLAARHDVAVAARPGKYVPLLEASGVRHVDFHTNRDPRAWPDSIARLDAAVRTFRPDVVHAHTMIGALVAAAVRLRRRYGLVTTVHNEFQRSSVLMGVGDIVTANSVAVGEAMRRRGVSAKKLRVVSIGALKGPRRGDLGTVPAAILERPAIVTVAGMYRRKGIDVLLSAFDCIAGNTGANVYLVGEGPDRAAFEEQARASPFAARIHFVGFERRPERYMRAADIFVLASRSEPFGMVLSEAREAGCAIVASDVGGIPEALDGGRAGLLVPPDNVEALANALLRMLGQPGATEDLRMRAKQNLAAFSAQRYSDDIERIYLDLLASKK
jgi:glycosyltransferase involved in cell wall biosynthesis